MQRFHPSLVESLTYRWRGHSGSDRNRCRAKEEINDWIDRDPIVQFSPFLIENEVLNDGDVKAIEASVDTEIEAAIEFAKSRPSHAKAIYRSHSEVLSENHPRAMAQLPQSGH